MTSSSARAYLPDYLLAEGRVHSGVALTVEGGRVTAVGEPAPGIPVERLAGRALAPGLVSAHSHAFQRAIRGRTEFRAHAEDDFWSWREAMYAAAGKLSPEPLQAISRFCFLEMARAGVTAVGEFHYLHRDPEGRPYSDPNELERRVIAAAREAGLRIVLLRTAYARGGHDRPVHPRQRRFIEGSCDEFLRNADALAGALRGDPLAGLGVAPHSVRACPAEWIQGIAAEAQRRGWPLHLHVSEQPAELEQCRREHGVSPPLLLERLGALGPGTTAVHAVHLDSADIAALARSGARVCACPTTERNLGDGVVPADLLWAAGVPICLGSDSQAQIAPLEEARELELNLRLLRLRRAVLDGAGPVSPGDPASRLALRLYDSAAAQGMASLGLDGGRLAVGDPADFIVVDLDDPSLAGLTAATLPATLVFALERTAIQQVYVAGERIVDEGHARGEVEATAAFRAAMKELWEAA